MHFSKMAVKSRDDSAFLSHAFSIEKRLSEEAE
jgi:hypothetical protein